MSITIAPPDHDVRDWLKEFLIFRVSQYDGHRELADDSALESEAARYAALMDDTEPDCGIHYEVRQSSTEALLYSTDVPHDDSDDESDEETEETTCTRAHQIPAGTP